jgi:hypothetical protein
MSTCFYCASSSTPTQGLVMGDNGRLRHVWPDEGEDGPLCPPLAPGIGFCSECGVAAPFADLLWLDVGPRYTRFETIGPNGPPLGADLMCRSCLWGPNAARRRARTPRTSRSGRSRPVVNAKPDSAPVDEALAAFKAGRATDVGSLALALDVSVDRARKQVQRLKRVGLIEVARSGQRGRPETLRAAGEGWLLPGDA